MPSLFGAKNISAKKKQKIDFQISWNISPPWLERLSDTVAFTSSLKTTTWLETIYSFFPMYGINGKERRSAFIASLETSSLILVEQMESVKSFYIIFRIWKRSRLMFLPGNLL